ncbi:hypothetical protein DTO027B5_7497 [Paecilomyces variotii]|nr:hypothetical protein DTO169C6_5049 [Paecilomyces variotii]KAJ9287622.1 hypothetical protein DTO021C3_4680 [Paecilomyces variotii]KAJ9323451.1 hypothetical protein DTO027B3_5569 [Paecilomyces variotii]KAJ9330696.1 hypothetical protein DTO027B5_7497 [Paecilomyces variotii]KAJ9398202.1 hypothetical protein DTO282F9_4887 [Paecilomyces variotii]
MGPRSKQISHRRHAVDDCGGRDRPVDHDCDGSLPRALPALITVCVPSGGEYSDEKVTVIILVVHGIEEYKARKIFPASVRIFLCQREDGVQRGTNRTSDQITTLRNVTQPTLNPEPQRGGRAGSPQCRPSTQCI